MILSDHFGLTLASLKTNLRRALLALIGITIGVAALIGLLGLSRVTREGMIQSLSQIGSVAVIRVELDELARLGPPSSRLTPEQADALAREVPGVVAASAEATDWHAQIERTSGPVLIHVVGVQPAYAQVMGLELEKGRFIAQEDLEEQASVAVIGAALAEELFSEDDDLLASRVVLEGNALRLIGRLKPTAWEPGNWSLILPLTTAQRRLPAAQAISLIRLRAESLNKLEEVCQRVKRYFQNHGLAAGELEISYNQAALREINLSLLALQVFLAAVGAFTLALGGIGLMNTILASLAERTREIGLRRALGASNQDIFWQFFSEALALSLIGSAAGLGLGFGVLRLAGWVMQLEPRLVSLQIGSALVVMGLTTAIGVAFSLWPVVKAARLDLVQALRYY